jgi:hypothetical protein
MAFRFDQRLHIMVECPNAQLIYMCADISIILMTNIFSASGYVFDAPTGFRGRLRGARVAFTAYV